MSVNFKGYSTIGTNNKEAAEAFYDGLLAQLEPKKLLANDRITMWLSREDGSAILAIAIPYDGNTAQHGNGAMKAIALGTHDEVISMYDKAIELCLNRFDEVTKMAFLDLFNKISRGEDVGSSVDPATVETEGEE